MSILDAGDIKSNHYYFHKHTYVLNSNEKIVGFRATKDPKGLAYFYNFQFVVMKHSDYEVKTYSWKQRSAQYRIFQRLLEKNWNYLKYLDFETFLNDADCVRFQAYLQEEDEHHVVINKRDDYDEWYESEHRMKEMDEEELIRQFVERNKVCAAAKTPNKRA